MFLLHWVKVPEKCHGTKERERGRMREKESTTERSPEVRQPWRLARSRAGWLRGADVAAEGHQGPSLAVRGRHGARGRPLHATLTRPCWQTFWSVSIWGTRIFRILQKSPFWYCTVMFLNSQPPATRVFCPSVLQFARHRAHWGS